MDKQKEEFWLWFTRIPGIGLNKQKHLLDIFKTPESIWYSTEQELSENTQLTRKDISNIMQAKDESLLNRQIEELRRKNIQFYSIHHSSYPNLLKQIYDPPHVIYVKGKQFHHGAPTIGIVGARRCSQYGHQTALKMAKELGREGISVISGLARGIDAAAHQGALNGDGHTMAILGNGVDICYPQENRKLYREIIENGALISEFPPGTAPRPGFFPLRNRIISGLSEAILVIEAARRSGSFITADQALEQGREVYAIPGNITSSLSEGTNRLIQQGAKLVMQVEDILEDLDIQNTDNLDIKNSKKDILEEDALEKEEKIVYDCLSLEPISIDQLCQKTTYDAGRVQHILLILELKGKLKKLSNQWFVKHEE
ncbi:MAG: DNA-protecting protein DprA [Epulopiscium sp.]|nr:DNA-protecting protein DprA [Candidatus Epulonipiscium sp.]